MVQSGKRRLTRSGIEREALAERFNPTQALLLNGVILRVQQAVGDDIRHLAERIGIKAPGGECCGTKAQAAGNEGGFGIKRHRVLVCRDVDIAEVKMEIAKVKAESKKDIAEVKSDLTQKILYSFVATVAVLGGLITVLEFRQPERLLDSLERIERRLPPPAPPAGP